MAEETPELPQDDASGASLELPDEPVASADEASAEEPKRDRVSERFAKLTRALSDKDRAIAQMQADIAALRQRQGPDAPATAPSGEPRVDDFPDYDAYTRAISRWEAKQVWQEEQRAQEHQRRFATWETQVRAAQAKYDDWDEALQGADMPVSEALREALLTSDVGADVLYYLATHPEEGRHLATLGSVQTARAIGRIEAKLEAGVPPPVPPAADVSPPTPPPVRPVGTGSSGGTRDPGTMSPQEYRAWRERQRR